MAGRQAEPHYFLAGGFQFKINVAGGVVAVSELRLNKNR